MTPTTLTPPTASSPSAPIAGRESAVPVPTTPAAPAKLPSAIAYTYKRYPITIVRGEGVTLWDDQGREYLDFMSGIAVSAFGHNDVGVKQAITDALECGLIHLSNIVHNEPAEQFARWLVDRTFADRVFFSNSGVEAVEGAFKFARRWARQIDPEGEKHEILAVRGSFHGRLFASVAATDRPAYRMPFRPLVPGISIVERDLDELAARISRDSTAAVIIEPVQGEGGVRPIEHSVLRELRRLTRERDVLLILDEIQCGIGRTGCFLAHEPVGIRPDIVVLAKPIAAGLPMGAILMTEEVSSALQPGEHGTTFGGGPLITAVAQHACERIAAPEFLRAVRENGARFGAQLAALKDTHDTVRGVRGVGYMWGVDVTEPAAQVIERARNRGLLLLSAGEHTLRILPPLVATPAELARGVAILSEALAG
jgi:acetylornithine/N-succinyldiaminopimelate aminotransferase